MLITRIESTLIPNTLEGRHYAEKFREMLRHQGAFRKWQEDSTAIIITAEFCFEAKAESERDNA